MIDTQGFRFGYIGIAQFQQLHRGLLVISSHKELGVARAAAGRRTRQRIKSARCALVLSIIVALAFGAPELHF